MPTDTPTPTPTPVAATEVFLTGSQWDLLLVALVAVVFVVGFLLVVKL